MESHHRISLPDLDGVKNKLITTPTTKSMILNLVLKIGIACVVEILRTLRTYCEKRRQRKREGFVSSLNHSLSVQRSSLSQPKATTTHRVVVKNVKISNGSFFKGSSPLTHSKTFNGFPLRKKYSGKRRASYSPKSFISPDRRRGGSWIN
ncbi:unnamed protein product [Lepeophtheirus salmonis]|uniref:(salmon louse) hypothetical protein n=1 Tax=Lepeophtheirus salmonis TaxID=72036 RepID=A0A7R8CK43_LEPSM|nr:unnamed protein product [Lepeophtheirus salmonis]CAF2811918.1 unnamed protein product [Lepeophtheirus salmonis]